MADETPFRNTSGQSYIQNYDFTPHAYIRTMPIQTPLQQAIAAAVYAADPNVQIRVSSGGQTSSRSPSLRNKPGGWTGSDRHNEGGAADFSLVRDGKKLPIAGNEGLYQAVARNLAAQGVPGIGVDVNAGYIHAGGGSQAAWGYRGKSSSSKYLPQSFASAINEGRQLHRTQGGIPTPPSEIPNVVASRTDTVAPRIAPVPATMSPEIAASREPQQYPPPSPRMSEEQVAALYQGIYPQRNLTYGGEVERSVQSAQNAQDPVLAAALQSRAAPRETPPLPRPRPAMGGDPGGGGLGTLIPRESAMPPLPRPRPSMGSDPGGGGVGTLVARVDPNTGQAVSVRDVPLPRPRPIMGGDPGGGGIGELVATIPSTQRPPPQKLPPLPPSAMASPRIVEASHDRANAAVDPVLRLAIASRPASANPLDEYNRLRGNPAIVAPSMAALQPGVPGPSIGYAKDQSRLSPSSIGMVGSGVAGLTSTAPIMVGMANPRMPPPPRPRPDRQLAPQAQQQRPIPAPLSQRPLAAMAMPSAPRGSPLQITVQGGNYGGGGQTVHGSATGQRYNTGQSYQSAGYNYQFNNDGSVTNTDTGITRGGNRRSYDPDTNTWG